MNCFSIIQSVPRDALPKTFVLDKTWTRLIRCTAKPCRCRNCDATDVAELLEMMDEVGSGPALNVVAASEDTTVPGRLTMSLRLLFFSRKTP